MAEIKPESSQQPPITTQTHEKMASASFLVKFWGVRGQVATPGKDFIRYGGNTPCLTMQVGGKYLIFDGGTGLRILSNHLVKKIPLEAYIFFTNCHWDRIQGFPFFVPAFIPSNCFHIYGANAKDGSSFEERLRNQMSGPNFPVPLEVMRSKLVFHSLTPGTNELIDEIKINTTPINYHHRSTAYQVNWKNYSVVYATDCEYLSSSWEGKLVDLARNADLLIINAPPTTKDDFNSNQTFWSKCIHLAKVAKVKQLLICIHHPHQEDSLIDHVKSQMPSTLPCVTFAHEGMEIAVSDKVYLREIGAQ